MDDDEIVDLFLARDEKAISRTSEKYGAKLRSLAYRVCKEMTIAEECENDTYLKAWEAIPPHTPKDYFFSFLAKITRCIAIDRVKAETRQKRNVQLLEFTQEIEESMPSLCDVEDQFDGVVVGKAISDFLRTLNTEKRCVFLRRYWFMDSISAISKRYSISEGKIKSMLFRTRKALYDYLIMEGLL